MKRFRFLSLLSAFGLAVPLHAENIVFADAIVKALCVAHWDTDDDGELSVEEAAAVTSLGEVFRGKTNIGSFSELRFFTGLTAIGQYAFSGSSIGPELVVPGNVKRLEAYCFSDCQQLCRVVLEEGVEYVGYEAFSGPIVFLSIPSSLTAMASMAINPYVNAYPGSGVFVPKGDITIHVSASAPAAIDSYAFYYVFAKGHLIVPHGCKEAYMAENAWSKFGEYIEVGDVNRDGRVDVADLTLLIAYIGGREHTDMDARIADVNGDGVLDGEDVSLLSQYLLGS